MQGVGYYNQGIHIYATAPTDRLTKKTTIFTGSTYWAEGTAEITELLQLYLLTDGLTPNYSVTFDGQTLTSGTDYTASITDANGNTGITSAGTYTLTITGKGNYAGSISQNFEVYSQESVPYIDVNGELQHNAAEQYSASNTPNGNWWYITGEVNLGNRIEISWTKHLILCDGATLTIPKGIRLTNGNTLHIYGQSAGTGKLIINDVNSCNAGIGGNKYEACGTLIVNGGEIDVTGGNDGGSGIGGGATGSNNPGGSGGNITINGGKVTANGNGSFSVGIGGGGSAYPILKCGNGGTITINGGIVSADGMGGPNNCDDKGTVKINWKNLTDKVYSKSYNCNVTLNGNFMLEGTDTTATADNIGGKNRPGCNSNI